MGFRRFGRRTIPLSGPIWQVAHDEDIRDADLGCWQPLHRRLFREPERFAPRGRHDAAAGDAHGARRQRQDRGAGLHQRQPRRLYGRSLEGLPAARLPELSHDRTGELSSEPRRGHVPAV